MPVNQVHAVPHLTTALSGPLQEIEEHLLKHQTHIEQWFRGQWQTTRAPFYASVDLRNAGFKLAPVDTNLFPAGFNNLNPAFLPLCIQAVQFAAEHYCQHASNVVLIPERHTRNQFYLESVASLVNILELAGFNVRVGSLSEDQDSPELLELPSGRTLRREPLSRDGNQLRIGDFKPCFVLLNNDLSAGRPAILEGLEQPVIPPLNMGWSNRLKSDHFAHYRRVVAEFAKLVDIDPWLMDPIFRRCGKIDYMKREGEECLVRNVTEVLDAVQAKYNEYGIDQRPFVFVKSDSGTYGMNVMVVHSIDEVAALNRKQRSKMARGKEGADITDVIVQEGVYTFETWGNDQAVAEPVVYMIDRFVVGGFYRVHADRGVHDNLNAPGMHFEPLAFAESGATCYRSKTPSASPNRFYAYGVVARLALLSAAHELANSDGIS
ncbi:MAG: glutamate--cysteine ligase [Gammaproteobacteria bacterium]|nr:glutamate--cysteine ligase [Gammaproteobacteria bacterium]